MGTTMPVGTEIRAAGSRDAADVARLSEQLGYPVTLEDARRRLAGVLARADHACFVATDADRVIGWVHVFESLHVESAPCAEIGGLVVDAGRRGQGIGAALLEAAEAWARQRGIVRVRVRSNVVRDGAHRFYGRHGYSLLKQQAVMSKPLER